MNVKGKDSQKARQYKEAEYGPEGQELGALGHRRGEPGRLHLVT